MRLRWSWLPQKRAPKGAYWSVGVSFGYWPCLRAPFVKIALVRWSLSVWFGLPSYLKVHT